MASASDKQGEGRGRNAVRPWDIPLDGWRDIARRVWAELDHDNISFVAAGVAFFGLLAVFPALAVMVALYGLVADPGDVQQQFDALQGVLPSEAQQLLSDQLREIASHASRTLSIGVFFGLLLTIWSAGKGMTSLITALNIVYDEQEKRGFLHLNGLSLALTLGTIVFSLLALALVVALPTFLGFVGFKGWLLTVLSLLSWPLLGVGFMGGLAVVYHHAPCRDRPKWQWVSPGALLATALWLMGSALFSFYVANFADYNETYGSVGAIVILLTWFYLTAYVVLLGAELNAEMEHQTREDTTTGAPEPMGRRGAYVADTLGPTYEQLGGADPPAGQPSPLPKDR